jgi:HAE1 family hydrophobic/amphiphilic exporter-1
VNAFVVFIRRPVFATMVTAFLVVVGLLSYFSLPVDQFPNVDLPMVNVWTTLRGASPEEMESQVTKPIEEAVNTIAGIDELRSYSFEGSSYIPVQFLLEKPSQEAVQDVRDRVAMAVRQLPTGTDPPVVWKFDLDAAPIAFIGVFGPRDQRDLREIAEKQVKPVLETVDGVGAINVFGGWKRAINVVLDADKLEALQLSVREVAAAVRAQHVDVPGGRIDQGDREVGLRTMARMRNMAEFNKLIVADRQGRQITLADIGHVEDTHEDPRALTRLWTRGGGWNSASVLVVRKQSGANTVEVIDRLIDRLNVARKTVPADVRVEPRGDQGAWIRKSIDEVKLHLVLGAILASLICFLFIRDWRATLIAALAIPTSILSTFALIKAMGFTINNMTMLGLTMSVGIVIDDAIVVLENIYRQMDENKKPPREAAIDGLKEIALAVMATTTSLVIIFLPVAFMSGRPGRFLHSFGITVAFAITVSLLVSFILTPVLCSKWLRVHAHRRNRFYEVIDLTWGKLLRWSLKHRWKTVFVAIALVATSVPLFQALGKDFLPTDDRSMFQVALELPEGSSLRTSDGAFKTIEADLVKFPGMKSLLTIVGDGGRGSEDVTKGSIFCMLDDIDERQMSQAEIMAEVRKLRKNYPGVKVSVLEMHGVGGLYPINVDIRGPDLGELFRLSNELMDRMRKVPGFFDIDSTLTKRSPELQILVDRQRAADLGVRTGELALSLQALVGGVRIGRFQEGAEQYDIWLRVVHPHRSGRGPIARLPIGSLRGGTVEVENVSTLREGRGPQEILRLARQRSVTVYANLEGLDMGRAMMAVGKMVKEMKLPEGYSFDFGGRGKVFKDMFSNFLIAFSLAFLFMYMILAAQFESFLHPITILLSLPLSLPCALFSLFALGETFNLYSGLGLFMLFGVVKKNGILQIDYTNTLRARGKERNEAILEANHTRLRPILMTTLTLIVGMIPIALGKGPGSGNRASMAKVIIGGQALSLVISLLIVPVAYSLFDDLGQKLRARAARGVAHFALWFALGIPAAVVFYPVRWWQRRKGRPVFDPFRRVGAICHSCDAALGRKDASCTACGAPLDSPAALEFRAVRRVRGWLLAPCAVHGLELLVAAARAAPDFAGAAAGLAAAAVPVVLLGGLWAWARREPLLATALALGALVAWHGAVCALLPGHPLFLAMRAALDLAALVLAVDAGREVRRLRAEIRSRRLGVQEGAE